MAAADFWTFDTVPVIKPRRGGDVTAEDLAQFQLKIGTKFKKLFSELTLDKLKETWSMADWTVAWDDLVYIYNWVVVNKTRAPESQWSCYIRMSRLGLASSRAAPNTARNAIAIAVISDSYISRFTKLDWDWEALDKLKISTPVVKTRASRRKAGENDDSDDEEGNLHDIRVRGAPPRHRVRRAHHSSRPRQTWFRGLIFDDVVDILKASVANARAYATDGRGESRAVAEMLDMVRSAPRPSRRAHLPHPRAPH